MEQLKLYQIDMKYVRDLHNADERVESVSPQIGKEGFLCVVDIGFRK
jgi:protein AbiQ